VAPPKGTSAWFEILITCAVGAALAIATGAAVGHVDRASQADSDLRATPPAQVEPLDIRQGERWHAKELAAKYAADTEVQLRDGTFCDLLSDELAIEVDWPRKWAEAVGQSLWYARLTGRKPAIILLLKDPAHDWRGIRRCAELCGQLDIALFIEEVDE